ncbi:MAG: glucoamylase family protein, partial [Ideonella sp.]
MLERHIGEGEDLGPAASWLLDNAGLLEQQIEAIHRGLPRSFFRLLPRLRDEPLAGLPRIYSVAWAWIAHTDSSLDPRLLEAYLGAYQQVRELTLAELWALPSTLRVVLLENLRRLAERIALTQVARDAAHHWIDQADDRRSMDEIESLDEALLARGVAEAFRLQLQQREDELPAAEGRELAVWLAQRLPDVGAALSHQQTENTEDHQSIRNAITTLRGLDRIDWRQIDPATNGAMRQLAQSPVFAAERDDTQDQSLHAVERLARQSGAAEAHIAQVLVGLAAASSDGNSRQAALAHWYDGPGEPALRAAIGLKQRRWPRFGSPSWRRGAALIYLSALPLLSFGAVISALHQHGAPGASPGLLALAGLLMLGPAGEAVVAVINRVISESGRPTRLPRLAFKGGIPADQRTLVVIPAMLSNPAAIAALAQQLEQHAIANPEAQAQFALLSDWSDASTKELPDDPILLDIAADAIGALNRKHPALSGAPTRFLLLHRARTWSESEQQWIGWERKRGKLEQLVRALCEPDEHPFLALGEIAALAPGIRHIVTLDADTDMPPGRLRALVGVAAHPLNQPLFDPQGQRVVAGYGILQPRVVTPLPEPETVTWFHRLFSGQCGIDPYSAASSEVYQDIFGEGTFTGKGLLNVAAVHAALVGRLPQSQVLSHDLLEGALASCASVSDITLVEDAPVHADVANSRLHRWTRGDWQLLPFILRASHFQLSTISRWKMIDNLRRSLVAPMSLLLLMLVLATGVVPIGWALVIVAAAFSAGPLLGALAGLAPSRDDIALRVFYRHALADLARALLLGVWHVAQLLQLAMLYSHAIALALYRQLVTRRGLLQWTTAAAAQAAAARDLPTLLRNHWRIPMLAVVLGVALLVAAQFGGLALSATAVVLLAIWAASPLWTWMASRPRPVPRLERLDPPERDWLQGLARDTWRYYEHHVAAEDHHLPPDNVQHSPHLLIAHRTSPTNIGMYLLTASCAQSLGFIGRAELSERLALTLDTLDRMPRHHGHFYNWYDTQTLAVLSPPYVSTVDSGNCSGHLLAVAGACEALAATPPSADAAHHALRVSARRLAKLRPQMQAADSMPELKRWCSEAEIDWPDNAAARAAMRARVQRAQAEFDALGLGLMGPHDDASMWLLHDHLAMIDSALRDLEQDGVEVADRLNQLAARCRKLAIEPDYAMLYDTERRLLHIGCRVETRELDDSHYDLLASESRLTSLLAIAKGDLPVEHWAALGRPFFGWGTEVGLKSWSGSMFEYLMPSLILDEPIDSVLYQVTRSAVAAQRADVHHEQTPWGISESAIAGQDHTLAYQYGPQGVARLALRRTPADERVIAPYASALALMVAPVEALANLRRLQHMGARHLLGFIEAIDYTPLRQVRGSDCIHVDTFMAHHQAMSLVAIADVLTDGKPRAWAMADPLLRAVKILLHERAPREVPLLRDPPPLPSARRQRSARLVHDLEPLAMALPATQLLTNGRHAVVLRSHGGGYSTWDGVGLTRWRDDLLRDDLGTLFYIRRAGAADWKSITAHPSPDPRAHYRCRLQADRVIFDANWPDLHSRCTVLVAPEDDCEIRQIELCNNGKHALDLTLASYAEP